MWEGHAVEAALLDWVNFEANQLGQPTVWVESLDEIAQLPQKGNQPLILLNLNSCPQPEGWAKGLVPFHFEGRFLIVFGGEEEDLASIWPLCQSGMLVWLRTPVSQNAVKAAVVQGENYRHLKTDLSQAKRRNVFLEKLPDLFFEADDQFRFRYVSRAVEGLLGLPAKEVLGTRFSDWLMPEDAQRLGELLDQRGTSELIRISELQIRKSSGEQATVLLSATHHLDDLEESSGFLGILQDLSEVKKTRAAVQKVVERMSIHVNQDFEIIQANFSLEPYLSPRFLEGLAVTYPRLTDYLADPAQTVLLEFALRQKESPPFPIQIKLGRAGEKAVNFLAHFHYDPQTSCLKGDLLPEELPDHVEVLSRQVEDQKRTLEMSVTVDEDTKRSILADGQNLIEELEKLAAKLEPFAYEAPNFELLEYQEFFRGKSSSKYLERLRFISNKIHSLKGSLGFILPPAKELCHAIEEITKPLAGLELVLTGEVWHLLRRFIGEIQGWVESCQAGKDPQTDFEGWIAEISTKAENARLWIGVDGQNLKRFHDHRSEEKGEARHREEEEYMSVQKRGYLALREGFEALYYSLRNFSPPEARVRPNHLLNELIKLHQNAPKVPIKLSRYLRLVPSLAAEYGKQAELLADTGEVTAGAEFWNAIHEILNHVLKNAVIHGIESPAERLSAGKPEKGVVRLNLTEDPLYFTLTLQDDGRGVNLEQICSKAVQAGVIDSSKAATLTEKEILDLLFVQGISTSTKVDQNAGRGVGLNAVQEAIRLFHGDCTIQTKANQGTVWTLRFPKQEVSLPCLILRIGSLRIAIPESNTEQLIQSKRVQKVRRDSHCEVALFEQYRLPVVEPQSIFGPEFVLSLEERYSFLVVKSQTNGRFVLPVNEVLSQALFPVEPFKGRFQTKEIHLGMTLFEERPLMVFNPEAPL